MDCKNNARVNAIAFTTLACAGGVVGYNINGGTVGNCSNSGFVKAKSTDIMNEFEDDFKDVVIEIYKSVFSEIANKVVENAIKKIANNCLRKALEALTSLPGVSFKKVENYSYAGGIVGQNIGGSITSSSNAGRVKADASTSTSPADIVGTIIDIIKLFPAVPSYPTIHINIINIDSHAGGITGWNTSGNIDKCQNSGKVDAFCYNMDYATVFGVVVPILPSYTGGISGYDSKGTVKNSSNSGAINSESENFVLWAISAGSISSHAGGMAGLKKGGTIENSANSGRVNAYAINLGFSSYSGAYALAGGVAGINEDGGRISNCMSRGAVHESWYNINWLAWAWSWGNAGGLVGENKKNSTVENSYWRRNNTSGFKHNATGHNKGTQRNCLYFDTAPGTLSGTAEYGTKNLKDALKSWSDSKGEEYLSWSVANIATWMEDGYPFFAQPVPVTFDGNGGTPASTDTIQIRGEEYVLPSNPSLDNKSFKGWFTADAGGSLITSSTEVTRDAFHTIYAQWSEGCTITVSNTVGGSIVGGNTSFFAGTSCTVTAIPEEDSTFVNWTVNGIQVSTDASYTFTVETPLTLTANFMPLDIEFFGDGHDGNLTVGDGVAEITFNINNDMNNGRKAVSTAVTNSISSGSKNITVANASGIEEGDEILVYIAQENWENMSSHLAGYYQFSRIEKISGDTLTLKDSLNSYFTVVEAPYKIQVIRVPNYNNVTVMAKGTFTCDAWDGITGGILVFRARSLTVDANGEIDVSGKGYKGGGQRTHRGGLGWFQYIRSYGMRGENVSNRPTDWAGSNTSDMNGGGAGYGQGGGGGGGNSTVGTKGDNNTSSDTGGLGGAVTSQQLIFGGGGGSGGTWDWNQISWGWTDGGAGGSGGGCVFIGAKAMALNNTSSSVKAEGENGKGFSSGNSYNGGGGGAGGSIYLMSRSTLSDGRVSVSGGSGGVASDGGSTSGNKSGGDGGTGRTILTKSLPPATSGLLTASNGTSASHVALTWVKSSYATSYKIFRSTSNNRESASQIATGVSGTSYNDTSAVAGATYYYWVKATNTAGDSGFSNGDTGYRAVTYSVRYNDNGHTGGSMADSSHTYNVPRNLTKNGFSKTGYTFIGWTTIVNGALVYTDEQSVINLVPQTGPQNTIYNIYAKWKANDYKVTFLGVGADDSSVMKIVTYDSQYGELPLPEREGYYFRLLSS